MKRIFSVVLSVVILLSLSSSTPVSVFANAADNEDLIQLGMIGLYKAMMNFSESYDVKFSTYAVPMISGEIKRFLRDDGMVKVSRNVKELYIKIKYAQSKFETKFSKAPKMSDLANELGVSIEDIIYTLNASESVYSLEETIDSDENKLYLKDNFHHYLQI